MQWPLASDLTTSGNVEVIKHKVNKQAVAALALWFHLRLPSCGPGFESQAHHLCFFQFVLKL